MLLLPDSSTQALIAISADPVKFVFQGFIIKKQRNSLWASSLANT